MNDAQATLFHPFETGALPIPGSGQRVLFVDARAGARLPEGFSREVLCVQGFRPDYLALKRAGLAVEPVAGGVDYDAALVLLGRHRQENEARLADALQRTKPGALIVAAGSKDDGVASLRRRIGELLPLDGHLPKYHGIVLWFRRPDGVDAAIRTLLPRPTDHVDGRFATAPGMFSHDRIDEGSRLLAQCLSAELKGHVADFCAGWGYLAREVAERCPKVRSIDLFEADYASLEAAKVNLAGLSARVAPQGLDAEEISPPLIPALKGERDSSTPAPSSPSRGGGISPGLAVASKQGGSASRMQEGGPPAKAPIRFFWHDLAAETVAERYDMIVMNPPFHTGRRAAPELGARLIEAAASALRPGGRLMMVANRQLPYEGALAKSFSAVSEVGGNGRFKVLTARR